MQWSSGRTFAYANEVRLSAEQWKGCNLQNCHNCVDRAGLNDVIG